MQYNMLVKRAGLLIILYCLQFTTTIAQDLQSAKDTLQLSLKETEKLFFEKNLDLLAGQYHIEAQKALIEQAKLWDNPTLTTDQNVYVNHKWFEHSVNSDGSYNGQVFVQVQQLIKTANKRGKLIQMSKTNAEISEWQFKEIMRNLKFQLRKDFFTIDQLLQKQKLFTLEQTQLDKLVTGMKEQYRLGNIAQKDLLRIQAMQLSNKQELLENANDFNDAEAELRTLLQLNESVMIIPLTGSEPIASTSLSAEELVTTAQAQNPSYKLEELQLQYQQQNLAYQKALAVPDVTLAPSYDRNSNYAVNYTGLGISLPLPTFNRNQGNIKNAHWLVKEQETTTSAALLKLSNDVRGAFAKWNATQQLIKSGDAGFEKDYRQLYENITQSYRQRQVSLIEFIDFFDNYKEMHEMQLQLQLNLQLAEQELNYQTGTDIFQ